MEHRTMERNGPVWDIPEKAINNPTKTDEAGIHNNLVCNNLEDATGKQVKTDEARTGTEVVLNNAAEGRKSASVSDEEDRTEVLRTSLVESSNRCLKKKLLIFDLNGLLADVVFPQPTDHKADEIVDGGAVFKRPFYLEFLKFSFENFEVAVWSSGLKTVVDKIVDCLMGDMRHRLLFCWNRSHCTLTSFGTLEDKHKRLIFKDLRNIWEKHDNNLPWEKGFYNESNTLLLDDSPYKALLNPPHTSIFPYTYTYQNQCDNALGVGGDLREYLQGLKNARSMAEYIEQNPYGQERITERSPSWSFYIRVMRSLSTNQLDKNEHLTTYN